MRPFFQNTGRKESRQRSISKKNQKKVRRFEKLTVLRREKRKLDFGVGKSESYPGRTVIVKFFKIPAYPGLRGVVGI